MVNDFQAALSPIAPKKMPDPAPFGYPLKHDILFDMFLSPTVR